jgi:hypothetical protein
MSFRGTVAVPKSYRVDEFRDAAKASIAIAELGGNVNVTPFLFGSFSRTLVEGFRSRLRL